MASVNEVTLIGKLGKDPETRSFPSGGKVVSFTLATSEKWKDKASGEQKEKTQWHRVAVFNEHLADIAERYLKKGSTVYLKGSIEYRKYTDKDGVERNMTEIVLPKFRGELQFLDNNKGSSSQSSGGNAASTARPQRGEFGSDDLDDDIPF